jgi:hypothetical protein
VSSRCAATAPRDAYLDPTLLPLSYRPTLAVRVTDDFVAVPAVGEVLAASFGVDLGSSQRVFSIYLSFSSFISEPCFELLPCVDDVLSLTAAAEPRDDDACRRVGEPDGGLDLVPALTTASATANAIDANVRVTNYSGSTFDCANDGYRRGRRVLAPSAVVLRYALDSVCARDRYENSFGRVAHRKYHVGLRVRRALDRRLDALSSTKREYGVS